MARIREKWAEGPPGAKAWGQINAKAAAGVAEVRIYDEIGIWGVTARRFADQIAELDVDTLLVYVNSPGGDAYDGIAIMNALRRHKAKVEVTVDGLAASAASIICMAADKLIMNRGSELMIHDTWTIAWGSADELRAAAGQLDKLSDSYADCYAQRAGGSREKWRAAMRDETWYTAEEAVEAGLADEWVDAEPADQVAARAHSFDLKEYGYKGRRPESRADEKTPSAPEPRATMEGDEMALRDDLIARLGLEAEASDTDILDAVDTATETVEPTGETVAAALPEGVVAVDADAWAQMQADAAAGREALENQATARRENLVQAAIADGRITPASKDKWLASLESDEANAAALLDTLAKGAAAPVTELGHSDEPENAEDALYAKYSGTTEEV